MVTQIHWTSRTRRLSISLTHLEYSDGGSFDYADSTTERWCEGFRSVMRKIGVLDGQQSVVGTSPSVGDTPLLVAMDYSYGSDDEGLAHFAAGAALPFPACEPLGNSSTGLQAPTHGSTSNFTATSTYAPAMSRTRGYTMEVKINGRHELVRRPSGGFRGVRPYRPRRARSPPTGDSVLSYDRRLPPIYRGLRRPHAGPVRRHANGIKLLALWLRKEVGRATC